MRQTNRRSVFQLIGVFLPLAALLLWVGGCGEGTPYMTHTGYCEGYSEWSQSDYVLPWNVGESFQVSQGNCGPASHFGSQRYAYDFNMPIGTPLIAARGGEVIEVEDRFVDNNGCPDANYVKIRHSDGTVALYLHLTQGGVLVAEGDTVVQGTPIALSGNTGCSSAPHLHFVVFNDETERASIPISFRNTEPNPRGLIAGRSYQAE